MNNGCQEQQQHIALWDREGLVLLLGIFRRALHPVITRGAPLCPVLLLGIFRRALHPVITRGAPLCPFTSQGVPCP
jgi:hypothetical protein